MSWIDSDDTRTWVEMFAGNIMKQGKIPYHLGFILDGNRRYAEHRNLLPQHGHKIGLDNKLNQVLLWCVDMGIKEVTIYLFSKGNFNRSKKEVDYIFKIVSEKFDRFLSSSNYVNDGLRFQVFGDWSMIPTELQCRFSDAIIKTRDNMKIQLNICFAYSARHSITKGVTSLVEGVANNAIKVEDIDEELVENATKLYSNQKVDVLIRTSELRLSDFLLLETSEDQLCFKNTLWPQYSYFNFLEAVFLHQSRDFSSTWHSLKPSMMLQKKSSIANDHEMNQRKETFLQDLRNYMWDTMYKTKK